MDTVESFEELEGFKENKIIESSQTSTTDSVTLNENLEEVDIISSCNDSSFDLDYPYHLQACSVDEEIDNLQNLFEIKMCENLNEDGSDIVDMQETSDSPTNNPTLDNEAQDILQDDDENREISTLLSELREKYSNLSNIECFPDNPTRRENERYIEFDIEPEDDRVGNTNWCTCSRCHVMPTYVESICCHEIPNAEPYITDNTCITLHEYFNLYCQREDLININLRAVGQVRTPPPDRDFNRQRRKTAYRFFTTWVHGYLGVGNRKPIPSCAVYLIRSTFPDPEERYMGFKESYEYPAEFMALE
ncbi:uncharacterized protein LOC120991534 [Bufo bufo]|uniref:uncharacterized protein LOC120991534 n=1 Tax=Bufo bufo TaxID=8384 RepID=UPI001ABE0CE7|nr:uncharacterized protein LOC120991534 [Bufo bufo]